jgi:hypothetical protein
VATSGGGAKILKRVEGEERRILRKSQQFAENEAQTL